MNAPSHANLRKAVGIFGKNGVGKSALTKQIIASYVRRGGRCIALDRQKQFGQYSFWPGLEHLDGWVTNSLLHKFQGLLVVDDADVFMVSRSNQVWKDLIASHRHYNLDLVVSARAPQNIDTTLLGCLSKICIFRTISPHALKHYDRLLGEFPGAIDQIPKVPYRYLEIDFENGQMQTRETVKM
jgi:hypothetical protein